MNELNLHPLSVGELLDKAFQLYRSRFGLLIGITAAVLAPIVVIQIAATFLLTDTRLVDITISTLLQSFATLALTQAISHAYLGKPITLGAAYSLGLKRFWSVFGMTCLMGLAVVPLVILAFIPCAGIFLMIGGFPFLIYLFARWSLASPAIILENMGAIDGLRRSWILADKFIWRILGTSFAANLLTILITTLPTVAANYLFAFIEASVEVVQVTNILLSQTGQLFALPFSIAVSVLIYYDLRIRKEAFDLIAQTDLMTQK